MRQNLLGLSISMLLAKAGAESSDNDPFAIPGDPPAQPKMCMIPLQPDNELGSSPPTPLNTQMMIANASNRLIRAEVIG
jgi:hypothetical protein